MSNSKQINILNLGLLLSSFVIISMGLMYSKMIIIPLFLAFIIYLIIDPIADKMHEKLKVSKKIYILVILFLSIMIITFLSQFFWSSIQQLIGEFDIYFKQFNTFAESTFSKIQAMLPGVKLKDMLQEQLSTPVSKIIGTFSAFIKDFMQIISLSLVASFFFLFDPIALEKLEKRSALADIENRLRHYILIKGLTSLLTGVIISFYLFIFGYKFVFFMGVVTVLLNFIPSFGSVIATFLLIPVFAISADSGADLLLPLIFPGIVQFLIGNIMEPKLMGKALSLGPIIIIFSLIFWGIIFGVYGVFLAVPLSLIVSFVLKNSNIKKAIWTQ